MIQTKVNYLKSIFNNDINACISLCNRMIEDGVNVEFYKQVKEELNDTKHIL